jgi:hypothetical protein
MTHDSHGLDQAKAQAASIAAMVDALTCDYERLQELRDERATLASAAEDPESEDETAQAIAALAQWDEDNATELNELEHAAGDCKDEDEARERIQGDPLSVEVRSAWDIVGGDTSAAEFRILLCTGGPAVQIRGELDNGTPCRAWLEYQDWGTPWAQFFDIEQSTLLIYCQEFYFGE